LAPPTIAGARETYFGPGCGPQRGGPVFGRGFVDRVTDIEPDGPVERLAASFVGGPEHVPVRMPIRER
jgi:hypothetical protein